MHFSSPSYTTITGALWQMLYCTVGGIKNEAIEKVSSKDELSTRWNVRHLMIVVMILVGSALQGFSFPTLPTGYTDANGCAICDTLSIGQQFLLGTDTMLVVDRPMLDSIVDGGYDATKVCVSHITDFSTVFYQESSFNQDISGWDVSGAVRMDSMFYGASSFNADISVWNVSSVTSMNRMLWGTSAFNRAIGSWDVSNVVDMTKLFTYASVFNQDLSGWDVSNVTDMEYMFGYASAFNQDLSSWDVSNVVDMSSMFVSASSFNQDLDAWDVSRVTNMEAMFFGASAFNGDISTWDVSAVTNMKNMFYKATAFNGDITAWDVGAVSNMQNMFTRATVFNQDLTEWCVYYIANEPIPFAFMSALDTASYPEWGTCVNGSSALCLDTAKVLLDPVDVLVITEGTSASFTARGEGVLADSNVSYSWQLSAGGGVWSLASDLVGATDAESATLTINNVTQGFHNLMFRAQILTSCDTIYTAPATLKVEPWLILAVANQTDFCAPGQARLRFATNRGVDSLRWSTGETSDTIFYSVNASADIIVTAFIGSEVRTDTVSLVYDPFLLTADVADIIVQEDAQALFYVQHQDPDASYLWQINASGSWINAKPTVATYSGAYNDTLIIHEAKYAFDGARFRCIIDACQDDTSNIATLHVLANYDVAIQASDSFFCSPSSARIWWSESRGLAADSVIWSTGAIGDTLQMSIASSGWIWADVYANGVAHRDSLFLTYDPALFTAHPQPIKVLEGTPVSLNVGYSDTTATYLWQYYNGTGWYDLKASATTFTGSRSATLTFASASLNIDSTVFRCVVIGCKTDTSEMALLEVVPQIRVRIVGTDSVFCSPTPADFWLNIQGASAVDSIIWNDVLVADSTSFTVSATQTLSATAYLRGFSFSDTLDISYELAQFITQPQDLSVLVGDTSIFTFQYSTDFVSYQWQYNTGNGIWYNMKDSSFAYTGGKSATLQHFRPRPSLDGLQLRCIVSGCQEDTSQIATLRVTTPPVFTLEASDTLVCESTVLKFWPALQDSLPLDSVVWQNGVRGDTLWYTVSEDVLISATLYRGDFAFTDSIPVHFIHPQIVQQPVSDFAVRSTFKNAQYTVVHSYPRATYQWQYQRAGLWEDILPNTSVVSGGTEATFEIDAQSVNLDSAVFRCLVTSCGVDTTNEVKFYFSPDYSLAISATDTSVCSPQWVTLSYQSALPLDSVLWSTGDQTPQTTVYMDRSQWVKITGYFNGQEMQDSMWLYQRISGITTQPQDQAVVANSPAWATFEVATPDTMATYQWQFNTAFGWQNLQPSSFYYFGERTPSFTFKRAYPSFDGLEFRCLINGCGIDTSISVTYHVLQNAGIEAVILVADCAFDTTQLTYQTTNLTPDSILWSNGQRGLYATFDNSQHLYAAVTAYFGGLSFTDSIAIGTGQFTSQPQPATIDLSTWTAPTTFDFSHTHPASAYRWQFRSVFGFWTNLKASTSVYTGGHSDTLTFNVMKVSFDGLEFRCLLYLESGCVDTSQSALLTVNAPFFKTASTLGAQRSQSPHPTLLTQEQLIRELETPAAIPLSVSPNPTRAFFGITPFEEGQYELHSELGELLESGPARSSYDLSPYPAGMYLIKVITQQQTVLLKVIKK